MKKIFIAMVVMVQLSMALVAETTYDGSSSMMTVGVLQGGGGLVGIDYEKLVSDRWGISGGIGVLSYGAALHYHLVPSISSHSIALTYWNQGFDPSNAMRYFGVSFVFRSAITRWTGQLGLASVLHVGDTVKANFEQLNLIALTFVLTFSRYCNLHNKL